MNRHRELFSEYLRQEHGIDTEHLSDEEFEKFEETFVEDNESYYTNWLKQREDD